MTEAGSGPFFGGIDLGAGFVKAVVMEKESVIGSTIIAASGAYEKIAGEALAAAVSGAGIRMESLDWITVTGYGKASLSFPHRRVGPLSAGARGAQFFFPLARTIIDVGVQQSSVVKLDADGNISDTVVSEKCAAGSGWFLRVVARVMGLKVEDLGPFSMRARCPVTITTDCAVFAETEVISRVAEGNSREDIIAGAHRALALKVKSLVERAGIDGACVLVGGTGKDKGFVICLKEVLGREVNVPEEPQLAAAIGAVLCHLRSPENHRGSEHGE